MPRRSAAFSQWVSRTRPWCRLVPELEADASAMANNIAFPISRLPSPFSLLPSPEEILTPLSHPLLPLPHILERPTSYLNAQPEDSTMLADSLTAQRPARTSNPSLHKGYGFSPVRLARMHDTLARHVEHGHTSGLVALVNQRGREHVETIGTMAFDSNVPMRRDTIFRLASTTKPITAVGAMILVEECRLRLVDPVDEWLPELAGRRVLRTIESPLEDTVPAKRPITLRDLLTFRSGYGEVVFLSPGSPLQRALVEARLPLSEWPFSGTSDEFMRRLGSLPLAHQPGEQWLYHMSAEILGVLIARVSGKSLGTFLQERI